jgi:3D (Asp-Asp-Asp) domain-containing protein
MDVCMNCGCQLDMGLTEQLYDCEKPADWYKLNEDEAMKVVACPTTYKLWTKFFISWLWEVVCRDRWGAIDTNRIDVRMGYGNTARDNWGKVIAWEQFWFIIED